MTLTPSQWEAAQCAAQVLMRGSPNREADRSAFREARGRLEAMLPADVDVREVISSTARWNMLNDIGEVIGG